MQRIWPHPGPSEVPLLGSLLKFRRDPPRFLLGAAAGAEPVVRFHLGPHRVYLVNDPDSIHQVLVTHANAMRKAPFNTRLLKPFLGEGLLTSEGEVHRRQRRLVQPAFHRQHIARYGQVMVAQTAELIQGWQAGNSYAIDGEMRRLTLGIISRSLFGDDVAEAADQIGEAIATLQAIAISEFTAGFMAPAWLPLPINRRRRAALSVLNRIVQQFIADRRGTPASDRDLLGMLLQARDEADGSTLSSQELRDEAVTLFIAGHETTANALTWTWYLLSKHPEAERRLHAELDGVLGGRLPTLADLPALPFTEMVVKEALRLYPPAWLLTTRTPLAPLNLGGYAVQPGDWVFISPYVLHRHPGHFPAPERFEPERFCAAREAERPRYAYLPFGGGPHVCIGNAFAMVEARLILATMAQRYRLRLVPGQTVVPKAEITLGPRDGLRMRVVSREGPRGAG